MNYLNSMVEFAGALVMAAVCSIAFGVWQRRFAAGIFMCYLLSYFVFLIVAAIRLLK